MKIVGVELPLLAPVPCNAINLSLSIVSVPIFKTAEDLEEIKSFLKPLTDKLDQTYITFSSKYAEMRKKLTWKMDDDTQKTPGWKFHEREMK